MNGPMPDHVGHVQGRGLNQPQAADERFVGIGHVGAVISGRWSGDDRRVLKCAAVYSIGLLPVKINLSNPDH